MPVDLIYLTTKMPLTFSGRITLQPAHLPTSFPTAHKPGKGTSSCSGLPHPARLQHSLQQVLVLVQMLEERWFTDELVLLAHLFAGLPRLSKLHLQGTEGWPHHLPMAEVLE